MKKQKAETKISERDVICLQNLVVAYNTAFLISSIFVVTVASSVDTLFADFHRYLSPSTVLLSIGVFVIFTSVMGYFGVARESSTTIYLYTMILMFISMMEVAAGLGILSFRSEIQSYVATKFKRALHDYPNEPMTANMVDYVQLQLKCCGVYSFWDWDEVFDKRFPSRCEAADFSLPLSCCQKISNETLRVNGRGCAYSLSSWFHNNALFLFLGLLTISVVQILGIYFSYTLASQTRKLKLQNLVKMENKYEKITRPPPYGEKVNYF